MTEVRDFWSRRKAAVRAEEEADRTREKAQEVAVEQEALEAKSDEEILSELQLPDPDELQAGDDFSGFMKAVVPDRIRRRALRRLWSTNPVLANVDGLLEYGEDYTDAATVIENLQTTYQVGKGMLKHVEAMAAQAAEAEATEDESAEEVLAEAPAEAPTEDPEEMAAAPAPEAEEAAPVAQAALPLEPEDTTPAPSRRRMRFAFDEAPEPLEG